MRADLDRGEVGAGLDRQGAEHPRLAAGAGAQVEPVRGHVVRDVDGGQREGDELGPLVLHRRAPVAHLRDAARVAGAEHDADRRDVAGLDVVVRAELVDRGQPGPGDDVHARRLVVGREQGGELGVDRVGGGAAVAEQGGAQRGDDPLGVAVPHRERGRSAALGHDGLAPLLERALAGPPHHGVDEPARPGPGDDLGQAHRLVGGGVRRDAHPEQLVHAQAQHVEHLRVDAGRSRRPAASAMTAS